MWIRYTITPPPDWSWDEICRRMTAIADDIVKCTGFLEVQVRDFRLVNYLWTPAECVPEYYGALQIAGRYVRIPELPGRPVYQDAHRIVVIMATPDENSSRFYIACAEYADTVVSTCYAFIPWHTALANPSRYKEAVRLFRSVMRRHHLRATYSQKRVRQWCMSTRYTKWNDYGPAELVSYPSRRDSELRYAILVWTDARREPILLRLPRGARFTQELTHDVMRLVGIGHYRVPAQRIWQATYQTWQAEVGGLSNFLCVHQDACAALKICEEHGFNVEVVDDGGFWDTWDTRSLVRRIEASDAEIENLAGILGNT